MTNFSFSKNEKVIADISVFTCANVPVEHYTGEQLVPCVYVEDAEDGECWVAWDLPEDCWLTDHSEVAAFTQRLRVCRSGVDKTNRTIEIKVFKRDVQKPIESRD